MEKTISLRPFLQELGERFSKKYGNHEGNAIARLLVEFYTGKDLKRTIDREAEVISFEEKSTLEAAATKVLAGVPIQYVTGETHFYGREFLVNPSVLIPRGETESLVQAVLKYAQLHKGTSLNILDIGTGSGCIPVTLSLELGPDTSIYGVDVSKGALEVAKANNERLGARVTFRQMDILTAPQDAFSNLHIIVSNPPYVTEADKREMQGHVLDHEPHLALFPEGNDPLVFYRKIAELGTKWLRPGGALFVEINEAFGKEVIEIFSAQEYRDCEIRKDIHGKDRIVMGNKL